MKDCTDGGICYNEELIEELSIKCSALETALVEIINLIEPTDELNGEFSRDEALAVDAMLSEVYGIAEEVHIEHCCRS